MLLEPVVCRTMSDMRDEVTQRIFPELMNLFLRGAMFMPDLIPYGISFTGDILLCAVSRLSVAMEIRQEDPAAKNEPLWAVPNDTGRVPSNLRRGNPAT